MGSETVIMTLAVRFAATLLAFGIVALISTTLHFIIAFSMSPPPSGVALEMTAITPARLAIAAIAILDSAARVALLFLCVARRHRPLPSLVGPSVIAGVGLFGLAASYAANTVGTALLARQGGPSLLAEVSIATSVGVSIAQPVWWLGLGGFFVYCALVLHHERAAARGALIPGPSPAARGDSVATSDEGSYPR
jgi:hypothetical protein